MIKMAKESTWTFEFTKDGDRWSVSNESNNTPKSTNTYEKEGKELVTKGPSGKCMKVVLIKEHAHDILLFYPSLVKYK